ncbi:DNA-packaging protein FI [Scandinavium goeteborgense]|uniref:DNA-packaging protein FI n=1 Tax=Scandinavium goeteborgense TaxID=1851514 RepID=UPI0021651DD3|nr:DNA-packaging protein FI [Scandinavium goeteborgense]MCS2152377.1 DNA-packaging protein FI [Scandinavium goeteborgense]
MNKSDLIAGLIELSGKLGRKLSTEGTHEVLQARFNEAQMELDMLEEPNDGGMVDTTLQNKSSVTDVPVSGAGKPLAPKDTQTSIQLKCTLDIWHYKKGGNKRRPEEFVRVREIISTGKIIMVDAEEAVLQVAENNAEEV